ncbi:large exoprotein [Microbacterium sp. SMR1]|uniref:large exoprotein n=1 Tax=Microbacterium sp. SMR1 TaxID=1497340 RepID=UPI000DCCD3EB|nr:large exoprotein [Microbacterium sp. SMR1]RAZ31261.1 large exoprotein [Microbacterium sp. SMR1]
MGGQVLGGGVIVLVAVALWMVYLLPSWHSRYRYDAAERNAVRLNQALRVLAETAEAPEEVRVELSTRTALAQQKLARQVQHEKEQLRLESERRRLIEARREVRVARSARMTSPEHRARVRRRLRLATTIVALLAVGASGAGGWMLASSGSAALLIAGIATLLVATVVLNRMAAVARRAARSAVVAPSVTATVQPASAVVPEFEFADARATWTPRELPRPLTASAGSRAAAVLDEVDAREALRQAAVGEAIQREAARRAPASLAASRAAKAPTPAFVPTGQVDDAQIEDHVRRLLAQRAAG